MLLCHTAPNPPEPWESAWDGAFQGLLDDIKKDLSLLSEENKPRDDVETVHLIC